MRVTLPYAVLLLFALPQVANGQSFMVLGSGGLTTLDSGHNLSYGLDPGLSLAAGIGIVTTPRLDVLIEVNRTHRPSQFRIDGFGDVSGFRGGTLTLAVGELRAHLFDRERVGPYGILGFAAGISRPNVNEVFPDRVTNAVRTIVVGGGVHAPLSRALSVFADVRIFVGGETGEFLLLIPARGGLAWKF
jgi:hypothetical protein